eukprot:gene31629-6825_t
MGSLRGPTLSAPLSLLDSSISAIVIGQHGLLSHPSEPNVVARKDGPYPSNSSAPNLVISKDGPYNPSHSRSFRNVQKGRGPLALLQVPEGRSDVNTDAGLGQPSMPTPGLRHRLHAHVSGGGGGEGAPLGVYAVPPRSSLLLEVSAKSIRGGNLPAPITALAIGSWQQPAGGNLPAPIPASGISSKQQPAGRVHRKGFGAHGRWVVGRQTGKLGLQVPHRGSARPVSRMVVRPYMSQSRPPSGGGRHPTHLPPLGMLSHKEVDQRDLQLLELPSDPSDSECSLWASQASQGQTSQAGESSPRASQASQGQTGQAGESSPRASQGRQGQTSQADDSSPRASQGSQGQTSQADESSPRASQGQTSQAGESSPWASQASQGLTGQAGQPELEICVSEPGPVLQAHHQADDMVQSTRRMSQYTPAPSNGDMAKGDALPGILSPHISDPGPALQAHHQADDMVNSARRMSQYTPAPSNGDMAKGDALPGRLSPHISDPGPALQAHHQADGVVQSTRRNLGVLVVASNMAPSFTTLPYLPPSPAKQASLAVRFGSLGAVGGGGGSIGGAPGPRGPRLPNILPNRPSDRRKSDGMVGLMYSQSTAKQRQDLAAMNRRHIAPELLPQGECPPLVAALNSQLYMPESRGPQIPSSRSVSSVGFSTYSDADRGSPLRHRRQQRLQVPPSMSKLKLASIDVLPGVRTDSGGGSPKRLTPSPPA